MNKKLLLAFLAAAAMFSASLRAEVKFDTVAFSAALAKAKESGKIVMVDFYTDWCGWCKVLDKKTYTDKAVGDLAEQKFISLKIDAERGEGVGLSRKYKIQGFPTIMFFNGDGTEVVRVVGFQDAAKFLSSMSVAIQRHQAMQQAASPKSGSEK